MKDEEMKMLNKIKYGDNIFEIIPNGLIDNDNEIIITHKMNGLSIDAIELIVREISNVKSIEVLDSDENPVRSPLEDYIVFGGIRKIPNYVIETVQIQNEESGENGEITYHTDNITEDVVEVILKRTDIRDDIKQIKAILLKMGQTL